MKTPQTYYHVWSYGECLRKLLILWQPTGLLYINVQLSLELLLSTSKPVGCGLLWTVWQKQKQQLVLLHKRGKIHSLEGCETNTGL